MGEEHCAALNERMQGLQHRINSGAERMQDLVHDAVALVQEAAKPEYADCSARICANDLLIRIYQNLDDVKYAGAVLESAGRMRELVDPTSACYACLTRAMVGAIWRQGDVDAALQASREGEAVLALHPLLALYHRSFLEQQRMEIAVETRDGAAASASFARLVEIERETSRWGAGSEHASVQAIAQNTTELIRECRILVALANGDVELAIEHYTADVAHDAPSSGRLLIQLALIEALTPSLQAQVSGLVDEAFELAEARGYERSRLRIATAAVEHGLSDDPRYIETVSRGS